MHYASFTVRWQWIQFSSVKNQWKVRRATKNQNLNLNWTIGDVFSLTFCLTSKNAIFRLSTNFNWIFLFSFQFALFIFRKHNRNSNHWKKPFKLYSICVSLLSVQCYHFLCVCEETPLEHADWHWNLHRLPNNRFAILLLNNWKYECGLPNECFFCLGVLNKRETDSKLNSGHCSHIFVSLLHTKCSL